MTPWRWAILILCIYYLMPGLEWDDWLAITGVIVAVSAAGVSAYAAIEASRV
jgi:hypothetical protein